ncbi:MAG TPA: glycosyltransferase N-terminal domain-containing protein [Gemmatimonadales bacterium]
MSGTSPVYRALAAVGVPLVPVASRGVRARAAHAARLAAPAAAERWARTHRDPSRPLAWFHASSVGEGLQALAVLDALRVARPDLQIAYTHFSPSAEEFAATVLADWNGYLCYDRRRDVDRMLATLSPQLLVFVKLDLWPELAVRASSEGARTAIVAATVSPASRRLRWPVRAMAKSGYRALDLVAAGSAEDAARMIRLGARAERVAVTGDPRIDSALDVIDATSVPDSLPPLGDPAMVLVAGSTWPGDEAVLLDAFATVRRAQPLARLVLAPHQPTPPHLDRLAAETRERGFSQPTFLSAMDPASIAPIVIVDRVGVLARLYRAGAMAYVGGGFGTAGIHSVLEPAAAARPVVIGPRDRGSLDAGMLESAGALIRLDAADPVAGLVATWSGWLSHPAEARAAGAHARAVLDIERGAAARTATLLDELLRRPHDG